MNGVASAFSVKTFVIRLRKRKKRPIQCDRKRNGT
uniref:Uncharacterized protein n=1 Tax=Arundo donax TaxID=35708 RepID=A0A0A8XZU3_ARUDO